MRIRPAPRPLERADIPALIGLCREHAAYERAPWVSYDRTEALERLFLDAEDAWCWVVDAEGETELELTGFASAFLERSTWTAGHYLHMDCLFLRAEGRGRGLGRALVREVALMAVALAVPEVQWQTPSWNDSAGRFYERLGARPAEKLRYVLDVDDEEQHGRWSA